MGPESCNGEKYVMVVGKKLKANVYLDGQWMGPAAQNSLNLSSYRANPTPGTAPCEMFPDLYR